MNEEDEIGCSECGKVVQLDDDGICRPCISQILMERNEAEEIAGADDILECACGAKLTGEEGMDICIPCQDAEDEY